MKRKHIAFAIFALIGVLDIATDVLGNILAGMLQEQLGSYTRLIGVSFLTIAFLGLGLAIGEKWQAHRRDRRLTLDRRNRQDMLAKVHAIWITGMLQHSLIHEILIDLELEERAAAVIRPLDLLVQRPDHADRRLPPGTRMVEVFDEFDRTLLILGVPGVGKTTRLLELTRDLLDRAERDPAHRIPVVFQLSSWATEQRPLAAWLVEELHKWYGISRGIGQAWVEADAILPLLDGLDEVASEYRPACVEAINTFRKDRGLVPLVVCSRTADYDALGTPLRLQGAVVVQPLTHAQVDAYLTQVGAPLAAVRQAVQDDSTLWELLDTPLMLAVITAACAGEGGVTLQMQGTLAERRYHLFTIYVDQMFRRRSVNAAYTRQQTEQWLTWLAVQMAQHRQTVFHLEQMQLTWLPYQLQPRLQNFRWRIVRFVGILISLLAMLAGRPLIGLVVALAAVAGICVGTLRSISEVNEELRRRAAAAGVYVGAGRSMTEIAKELWDRAAGGGPQPTVMALEVLRWWLAAESIISVETLRWSWSGIDPWPRRFMLISIPIFALAIGLGVGVGTVLNVAITVGLNTALTAGPSAGLAAGLNAMTTVGPKTGASVGLFAGVAETLFWGLVIIPGGVLASSEIERKMVPNQGIRRSAWNALRAGLVGGLAGGLAGGLLAVLGFTLSFGLAAAMRYGGYTWLQHRRLRRLLVRRGLIPRRYVDFLDYAVSRIFLHKVGGGYIFIHKLLQDHFAMRYRE